MVLRRPSGRLQPTPHPEPGPHPGSQDKCDREHHPPAPDLGPGGHAHCGEPGQPKQADCGTHHRGSEERFHAVSHNDQDEP